MVAATLAAAAGAAVSNPEPLPASPAVLAKKPKPRPLAKSPDLWATINACDTEGSPNTIGIRGSMPPLPKQQRSALEIRFRVQYETEDGDWEPTDETGDSGWRPVGKSRTKVVETGQDFEFEPPATGAHTLRGQVAFRWKRKGRVVEELRELTEVGHRSTAGADPEGYSAATCEISAP